MTQFERLVLRGLYIIVLRLITGGIAPETKFETKWIAAVEQTEATE